MGEYFVKHSFLEQKNASTCVFLELFFQCKKVYNYKNSKAPMDIRVT